MTDSSETRVHTISVVIPVYRGELTLRGVVAELLALTEQSSTPAGRRFEVAEIVLVHDAGPDRSDAVIHEMCRTHPCVRAVWLSRNFGQHAATLAGMASTGSTWIVTMDEDGQFDPADVPRMLDTALDEHAQLVYALPTNPPPHGRLRNTASSLTKWFAIRVLASGQLPRFSSFRLMLGEIGRGVAAYVGPGVYLDVALTWAFGRVANCPVRFRDEGEHRSGYSFRKLLSHFWQLVITAGTRPLRFISLLGVITAVAGFALAVVIIYQRVRSEVAVQGWSSVTVITLVVGGAVLFSLGVIAEYVGASVRMAMGKPLYLIVSDPAFGPLAPPGPAEQQDRTLD